MKEKNRGVVGETCGGEEKGRYRRRGAGERTAACPKRRGKKKRDAGVVFWKGG